MSLTQFRPNSNMLAFEPRCWLNFLTHLDSFSANMDLILKQFWPKSKWVKKFRPISTISIMKIFSIWMAEKFQPSFDLSLIPLHCEGPLNLNGQKMVPSSSWRSRPILEFWALIGRAPLFLVYYSFLPVLVFFYYFLYRFCLQ